MPISNYILALILFHFPGCCVAYYLRAVSLLFVSPALDVVVLTRIGGLRVMEYHLNGFQPGMITESL